MSIEVVVASIQALSGSPGDLSQLLTQLKQSAPSLVQLAANIPQALTGLDYHAHSLGTLFLLDVLVKSPAPAGDAALVDSISRFLSVCDSSQVKLAPEVFGHLCRRFKELSISTGCPRKGILPLISAIRALQPFSDFLTPVHGDLFQLCLLAKCYSAADSVLDEDIFDVDPSKTACTPTDLYLYCYYGGMVCIGKKQYARALELFTLALTAPTHASSAIVLAVYKKHVLTSLIHTGSLAALPKFTPGKVKSMVETEARAYNELANAYGSHNVDKLNRVIDQHAQTFNQDTNMGLVKQVAQSLTKRNVQRLTQTYLTLSLADIAAQVGLASAEAAELCILRMIESGDIFASISERDGMVRFLEDPQAFNCWETAASLDGHVRKCLGLAKRVQTLNETVSADRAYLSKVSARERNRFDGAGAGEGEFGAALMGGSQPIFNA